MPHKKGSKTITNLDLQVVLHYGIPYTASILAFDPIQRLLAIGTLDGRIKIVGGDNIEGLLLSPKKLPYKYLEFLQNQGLLIGVTNDNDIQVWDLEHRQLVSSFQCETNITAFAVIHGTSLMYIGDDNGTLSVLRYDSEVGKLLRLPYNIPAKSIYESAGISCPIHQSVVGVLPQPSSSGTRVLIAYENGLMILWDVSESHVITVKGYTDLQLKDENKNSDNQNEGGDEQEGNEICSLCWVSSSGSILAVGYINGDILLWDVSSDSSKKRQSTSSSSKAVVKLQLASGNRRLPVIVLNWSANAVASDKGGQLLIYGGDDMGSEEVLTVLNLEWSSGIDSLKLVSRSDLKLNGSFADMILIPNAGATEHNSTAALFVLTNPGQLNVYDGALLPVLKSEEDNLTVEAENFPMIIPTIDPCITAAKLCSLDPESNSFKEFLKKAGTKGYEKSPTLSCGTRWPLTGGIPSELCISNNGVERIYITAYQDGSVRIWDATCPILSLVLRLDAKIPGIEVDNISASVSALDICPKSASLAIGNESGLVRIYKLQGSDESIVHLVGQNTQEVLTAQEDGSHCAAVFIFQDSSVQTLAFTHTGQKLAVGLKNGQVAMLDMSSWSILFSTDCSANAPSPVVSISFHVDPQSDGYKEVVLILKKDGYVVIADSMSGELVSSRQILTKNDSSAVTMYVIDRDNHVTKIANEKLSENPIVEKSLKSDIPSDECSNDDPKTNELLLDSLLLLCIDYSLWLGPLTSAIQGSSDSVRKANLSKRCCWSAVFKKRNEEGCGLLLFYETGDLEMRSLPDLEVLAENSLMSILRWSFKTNMEKTMSSYANGLIAMVNGSELAIVSLLECENDFRIPESLPCLHDKVVAAAADAAISLSANQKKTQQVQHIGTGIIGGIIKGLKASKQEHDHNEPSSMDISSLSKLEKLFSNDPFVNISDTKDTEVELSIDDIKIDDDVPTSSSSSSASKHKKTDERADRERLFQGATVVDKPRVRTTQEIMTKYKFNGDAQAAAAAAKEKLMERQEKLEKISLRTAELQDGAENFADMAHELAKRMEKKKWWNL